MFTVSYLDPEMQQHIALVRKSRKRLPNGYSIYIPGVIPPAQPYEGEAADDDLINKLERYTIDKHYKKYPGVPPVLVLPKPLSERVVRTLVKRHCREFGLTIEVDDKTTKITFAEVEEFE